MKMLHSNKNSQQGATLVVSLVMLVVLTLLVISSMRSSNSNLRIAGNMQLQEEVISAAQQATEMIISNNFTTTPAASSVSVTIGMATYTVAVATPTCTGSKPMLNSDPNLPKECVSSDTSQNTGIMTASALTANVTSWCYSQQWEVQASVSDSNTGANTTVTQGISLNVPAGTTC